MTAEKNPTQSVSSPWMITEEKVRQAIDRLIEIARPLSIVLFGSYVRGTTDVDSDLDVLIIADIDLPNCRKESVRLRRALQDILMPMDLIVIRRRDYELFKNEPGLIFASCREEGRLVYER